MRLRTLSLPAKRKTRTAGALSDSESAERAVTAPRYCRSNFLGALPENAADVSASNVEGVSIPCSIAQRYAKGFNVEPGERGALPQSTHDDDDESDL